MSAFADRLAAEADAAIATMVAAAQEARRAHARAELMRHMLTTARKVLDKPRHEAIEAVVREWMAAWHLDRAAWPELAGEMEAYTGACRDVVAAPSVEADAVLQARWEALEAALASQGTSIAEQMAWRSQCAHRWWELVAPTPADLPGRQERPSIPAHDPTQPFWMSGCAPFNR